MAREALWRGRAEYDNRSVSAKTHVARVAWDTARAIVQASADPQLSAGFANWFTTHAGPPYGQLLVESRARLSAGRGFESAAVEAGVWRVRLDDLLHDRPDLVQPLASLIREVAGTTRTRAA